MSDQPVLDEEVRASEEVETCIEGNGEIDETIVLDPKWWDTIPLESRRTSKGKRIGDLIWLGAGITSVVVTMIAAGIGCGVWLEQWRGWSPAAVTALVTTGGLAMLGWSLFRE